MTFYSIHSQLLSISGGHLFPPQPEHPPNKVFFPYVYKISGTWKKRFFFKYFFYKQFLPAVKCAVNRCHFTMQLRRGYAQEIFHDWWCKNIWKHAHLSRDYM